MHHEGRLGGHGGVVEGTAQHVAAALQMGWQGLPVEGAFLQLLIGPAFHGRQFIAGSRW